MRRFTIFMVVVLLANAAILAMPETHLTTSRLAAQEKGIKIPAARVAKNTGHVSNYDESKIKPYTLPDVLKMVNGDPVNDADTWFKKRRPEILKLFQTEIFGRVPDIAPKVKWSVASTDAKAKGGTAIMKKIVGVMGDKADGPRVNVSMYIPANAKGPVPCILTIGFSAGGMGDPVADILKRGYAYATVGYGDFQPDKKGTFNKGAIGLALKPGKDEPAADEWGTVSAWAWGISRIVDYLETDKAIDAKCIGIQGHSRLGRTVLWAAAQDERIAATFASCSGCAGAALARRDWGESVDDMAQNYGFQLGPNYQKWVGKWNDMPVDSHMLIASVAPRALFCNGGTSDQWAAPKSQFLALVAAGPVYKLVGKKDLGVTELPPFDKAITSGDLGWVYHTGGHTATPADWTAFLDFAGRHFTENAGGKK